MNFISLLQILFLGFFYIQKETMGLTLAASFFLSSYKYS